MNIALFLTATILAFSRGAGEYFFGRSEAYAVQAGGIVLCLLPLLIAGIRRKNVRVSKKVAVSSAVFLSLSLCSLLYTRAQLGGAGFNYFILCLFFVFLLLFSHIESKAMTLNRGLVLHGALAIGGIVGIVGQMQAMGIFFLDLPGHTVVDARVPSLTGSFLHYPLVMAILGAVSFVVYIRKGKSFYLVPMLFFSFCTFSSLSRSGMLILIASLFAAVAIYRLKKSTVYGAMALFFVAISALLVLRESELMVAVLDRLSSAASFDSDGNSLRYGYWIYGLSLMGWDTFFIGKYFGIITNSAPEYFKDAYSVVESGLLQQILNVGLVAAFFYYYLFLNIARFSRLESRSVMCVLVPCMVQTLFYQSIEVIPFLFLVCILPLLIEGGGDDLEFRANRSSRAG